MDINDFDGLFKYKVMLPITSVVMMVCAFTGPFLIPSVYQTFTILMISFGLIKSIMNFTSVIIVTYFIHRQILVRAKKSELEVEEEKAFLTPEHPLLYAFVIPNYKEDLEVLQRTLSTLAGHSRAHSYCIFLGMEQHEPNSDAKAQHLIAEFQTKFGLIHANYHSVRQFEQKGKASNVSSVVENAEPILREHNVDPENLFFTIIDADTQIPPLYIDLVDENILSKYDERYKKIFVPPQIFCSNEHEAASLVRAMDNLNSVIHMGQFHNPYGASMPFSNYSLSYNLIKRIGYWDTCADAIGEDYHTAQKAFWKTDCDIITENIYCSTNQMSIVTGKGSWEDFKARFWQCERHCEGCASFAYSMNQFLKKKKTCRSLKLILFLTDIYLVGIVLPWINISLLFQTAIRGLVVMPAYPLNLNYIILPSLILCQILPFFLYYYKVTTMKYIFKEQPKISVAIILEMIVFFLVLVVTVIMPSFFISSMRIMNSDRKYVVAEKKLVNQALTRPIVH